MIKKRSYPKEETCTKKVSSNTFSCRNIDCTKGFGVTRDMLDRIQYLPELIKSTELYPVKEEGKTYACYAKTPTSCMGEVVLEYKFQANSDSAAIKEHERFQKDFAAALKLLMAFWSAANKSGAFSPIDVRLTGILKQMSKPTRKSSISVKEKRYYWQQTKRLESTKITFWIKSKELAVDMPLLKIDGSSQSELKKQRDYPDRISFTVLDPTLLQERSYRLGAISNGTLLLPLEDMFFALALQARAAQRKKAKKTTSSRFDKEFLYKIGGLLKTKKSNERQAKQHLLKKINRAQKAGFISSFKEKEGQFIFMF